MKKTKKDKELKIVVSDIEASNWINFLCIGFYDGETYEYFQDLSEYFEYIFLEKTPRKIYFHYGGGYDFLFLIDHVFNSSDYELEEMIPRGSSFLSISIRCNLNDHKIIFLDSSALLPFSLKKLSENFKVETMKGSIDHEKVEGVTPELLAYMKDDHLALHQVLTKYSNHKMIKKVGLKLTRSGQAFSLFQKHYLKAKIIPLKDHVDDFCRNAYQGGRTEIFKPLFIGNKNKKLYSYDVNSLYPSVMMKNDFPIKFKGFSRELNLDVLSIWHVKVRVPEMKIPPLGITIKGKYIFPIGEFQGYWTNIELKMAVKYGVEILETYKGVEFENGGKIFKGYIEEMYAERKASNKKSADNIIYKDMMNHVYGRYALKLDREKIVIDDGSIGLKFFQEIKISKNKYVRLALQPTRLKSFTFSPIAIFTTSYARVSNYENFIKPYENNLYYHDTDSFYTDCIMQTSDELGDVKEEDDPLDQACFLLPKSYIKTRGNDVFVKLKGMDTKVKKFQFDDFLTALEGDLRLMRVENPVKIAKFKESLRRNKKILSILDKSSKSIKSSYDKRKVIKIKKLNYDTKPLEINIDIHGN